VPLTPVARRSNSGAESDLELKNQDSAVWAGAAFPTHIKLSILRERELRVCDSERAECGEPYLMRIHRLMLETRERDYQRAALILRPRSFPAGLSIGNKQEGRHRSMRKSSSGGLWALSSAAGNDNIRRVGKQDVSGRYGARGAAWQGCRSTRGALGILREYRRCDQRCGPAGKPLFSAIRRSRFA
jgi:hypothetical protein